MSISNVSGLSGAVDFTEMRKKLAGRMADRMMKDLDNDGDGAISKEELGKAQAAATGSAASTKEGNSLDELFKALDADSDGAISKAELSTFMEKAGPPAPPSGKEGQDRLPGGPPPGGPPPDSASSDATSEKGEPTEANSKERMAHAYQQLMSLLQNLSTADPTTGTSEPVTAVES